MIGSEVQKIRIYFSISLCLIIWIIRVSKKDGGDIRDKFSLMGGRECAKRSVRTSLQDKGGFLCVCWAKKVQFSLHRRCGRRFLTGREQGLINNYLKLYTCIISLNGIVREKNSLLNLWLGSIWPLINGIYLVKEDFKQTLKKTKKSNTNPEGNNLKSIIWNGFGWNVKASNENKGELYNLSNVFNR